jgi:Uma2 family endonuclease
MAALAVPAVGLEYPESDGRPMGETDLHIDETIAIRLMLEGYYAERKDVYVTGNNLIYYEQGNVAARVSPDVYVVHGVPKGQRRTYKLWEEKKPPSVVIEVTSKGTWLEDEGTKRALYARVGVKEYFLYDPGAEYLRPPLQGYALRGQDYAPLRPRADGSIRSAALDLTLRLEGGRIALYTGKGHRLLRHDEVEAARREAEAARRDAEVHARAEAHARQRAEARARAAEAELARLKLGAPAPKSKARSTTKSKTKPRKSKKKR